MRTITIMDFSTLYTKVNTDKLIAQKPTLIGNVLGVKFYEHPTRGDEVGMIAIDLNNNAWQTDWYDLPRDCDIIAEGLP